MENFWDSNVWGFFNLMAVLLLSLLAANVLRKTVKGLNESLIPTSVLGGGVLLVISAFYKLFTGVNMYGSSMFTALNNGLVSAVISFVRTLICQLAAVILLPLIWQLDGIWWSVVAAEFAALLLTIFCFIKYRKRYHYL